MPRHTKDISKSPKRRPPATTPEARENQLISLAVDLAEKQLAAGTASSQTINHYLKLASSKEKLERELLEEEIKLKKAKTESIASAKRIEELYKEAVNVMSVYQGHRKVHDDVD